ncbi:hypothetical protein [Capnocytophaga catalasegens]|uniref:SMI1/KNR4 family protein n=1 Tax=Capnocytophaga catalasegens TaxID=1004260 RepID=A0AAV5ATK8_9FLAO|nr:hypothetical protein [Capnocytophaga catalasegens]GIZ14441.1 hypothetical protein RCZ03_04420 [Capnocytophaga catalasegens]GJM50637.1 hypothetical protein RCZ15_16100 [Capnocytophaga catalasegens]GJM53374.1 hypothetical protein RCZ16_16910 [Capnocytophaga catalasegens]
MQRIKDYFKDLNINTDRLLPEEIDIINDWYTNYSKFDRNVHLFDAEEIKIYKEHIKFLKEEYENLSFFDDFWLFSADEDSNCAGIMTKGSMRGWIFFISEEFLVKPVFRTLENFYQKVKSEEITNVSAFGIQSVDFQNKHRTANELNTDNQVFDELLQKIHHTENKHDRYLYMETLITITPPDRLGELTQFLFSEDYWHTSQILEVFDFYNHHKNNDLLYKLGKEKSEFRKKLKQMGIQPQRQFLWWEKW